ncbi:ABC transporter substrate-binding protein [uncultured Cohaesibacter sp.]|uniref:ABC transporter substrate-binding protein n=1 Tax=uncultured Cohaesibacter sp. TaxID=1002546 RepID=UPI00292DEF83|nr:ABC transporter substrate-binding protein [uncultured Cohaesibacter sp.]
MRAAFACAIALCLSLSTGQASASDTVVIKDMQDREVTIPADPKRIVSIPVVMPPMLTAVDGTGDRIVGMHPVTQTAVRESVLSRIAPELLDVPTGFIQGGFKVNLEEILKLKPDLVFQVSSEQKEIEKMESVGLPVIATDSGDFYDYYTGYLDILGKVLGKADRAQQIRDEFDQSLEQIRAKTADIKQEDRPKGLILFNVERLMATGTGSFANYWLENTGARNVASDIKTSPRGATVNMEQILSWDPDVIYITNFCSTTPEDLYENKVPGQDWSAVKAVKEKRVYKIPLGIYRWYPPSADSALMLKWMASINQPDLFADIDIREEMKDYFSRLYDFTLSEDDIDHILKPDPTSDWKWN